MQRQTKIWRIHKNRNPQRVQKLNQELGTPEIIGELLVKRGIHNFDEAKRFFRPDLNMLHDPFLMKDMLKACKRIQKAIDENEKILIYGDYDVDGTCSVALLNLVLPQFGAELLCYQPDRFSEGYGISLKGIDYAKEQGCSLIIALDCGISAQKQVAYANSLNLDFIICDHHLVPENLPDAHAILNPKQPDCNYPFKALCGCAIGFKLMCGLEMHLFQKQEKCLEHMDIVATATAADIVSMTGENRVITHLGLKQLNLKPSYGLASLIDVAGFKDRRKELDSRSLVFQIAPRINAAGRLKHASFAREILSATDQSKSELALALNRVNQDRQALGKQVFNEAVLALNHNPFQFSQVVASKDWNKGVIGIVASKLIEISYKPTVVFSENENGELTGSVRSIEGVNVYLALEQCQELLIKYGGHQAAAGLSLHHEQLDAFCKAFDQACKAQLNGQIPQEVLPVDAELLLKDINAKQFRIVNQFEPFGPDNLAPRYVASDAVLVSKKQLKTEHLKLELSSDQNTQIRYDALMWGAGNRYHELPEEGEKLGVVYQLDENEFRGQKNLQLILDDFKLL